jgi:hypothetical protein
LIGAIERIPRLREQVFADVLSECFHLTSMRAARMGTRRIIVMDMGRRHGVESAFAVEAIESFQFSR